VEHQYRRTGLLSSKEGGDQTAPEHAEGQGAVYRPSVAGCSLPAPFGFLKGFGLPSRGRAPGHARFGLGFGLLLGYRAAGDSDDVVLYRGDLAPHARPDTDREALVGGFSYLLLVRHFVALGD